MKNHIIIKKLLIILFCCAMVLPCGLGALAVTEDLPVVKTTQNPWTLVPCDYYVYVLAPDGLVNIRVGVGVKYKKVIPDGIPNYERLHIIEETRNKKWGYAEYHGKKGYLTLTSTVSQIPTTPIEYEAYTAEANIKMYDEPSVDSKDLGLAVPKDLQVQVQQRSDNAWVYIVYKFYDANLDDVKGWIKEEQLTKTPPPTTVASTTEAVTAAPIITNVQPTSSNSAFGGSALVLPLIVVCILLAIAVIVLIIALLSKRKNRRYYDDDYDDIDGLGSATLSRMPLEPAIPRRNDNYGRRLDDAERPYPPQQRGYGTPPQRNIPPPSQSRSAPPSQGSYRRPPPSSFSDLDD
ncbi:MAG: hypothetical protein LBS74_01010 [Oscillospiraceae bacterium]|jgi:uncharacterized protein YgiM (DUF1202 family)|nr:hypothetical protein [Oscillospiraceae bacterium]